SILPGGPWRVRAAPRAARDGAQALPRGVGARPQSNGAAIPHTAHRRVRARRSATADHFGTGSSFATRNQNLRNMAGPSRRPQSRPASNQSQKTVRHHLLQTSWRQEDGPHDKQILCHNYVTDAHRLTDGADRREPVRRGSNDAGERQPAARAYGPGNGSRAQCLSAAREAQDGSLCHGKLRLSEITTYRQSLFGHRSTCRHCTLCRDLKKSRKVELRLLPGSNPTAPRRRSYPYPPDTITDGREPPDSFPAAPFFYQPQLVRASAPKCFSVLQLGKRLRCRSHRGIEPRILASGQQSRGKGTLRAHPPTLRAKRGDDMLVHRDVVEIAERMLQRFKRQQEFLALL